MFNKHYLILPVLIVALIVSASCAQPFIPSTSLPNTVRVGAFIGLHGEASEFGLSQKNGIELAVKEINSSNYLGTDIKIEAVIEDAGSTADSAVEAINKLIHEHKVVGIIGPTLSAQAFAAGPHAQESSMPLLDISNAVLTYTDKGDYVFRLSMPESSIIDAAVKAAFDLYSLKTAGIIWQSDDDYTNNAHGAFLSSLNKYGINIVLDNAYTKGTIDFSEQLAGIGTIQPDALIIAAYTKDAASIVNQARDLKYRNIFIGGNGLNTTGIIDLLGKDAEGIIAGNAWNKSSTAPRALAFISAYEKEYGDKPDQYAAQAYTATWLFARAIRVANSDNTADVRDALSNTRDYNTPLGSFSFTEERNPDYSFTVRIIRSGVFVPLNKDTAFVKSEAGSPAPTGQETSEP